VAQFFIKIEGNHTVDACLVEGVNALFDSHQRLGAMLGTDDREWMINECHGYRLLVFAASLCGDSVYQQPVSEVDTVKHADYGNGWC
jgi:hypothetical protein